MGQVGSNSATPANYADFSSERRLGAVMASGTVVAVVLYWTGWETVDSIESILSADPINFLFYPTGLLSIYIVFAGFMAFRTGNDAYFSAVWEIGFCPLFETCCAICIASTGVLYGLLIAVPFEVDIDTFMEACAITFTLHSFALLLHLSINPNRLQEHWKICAMAILAMTAAVCHYWRSHALSYVLIAVVALILVQRGVRWWGDTKRNLQL